MDKPKKSEKREIIKPSEGLKVAKKERKLTGEGWRRRRNEEEKKLR